jgi:hypothetical protein
MNICVFCSSSNLLKQIYVDEAFALGRLIGSKKYGLVYGGTNVGLMNEVARSVKLAGGKALGVIPKLISDFGIAASYLDELIITPDMSERKKLLREKSDAFIALPGGFGTLEEVLEVITLKQLGYHNKPIVFINTNSYYNHLIDQFELSYQDQFAKSDYKKLYYFSKNCIDAVNYIENYRQEKEVTKWG